MPVVEYIRHRYAVEYVNVITEPGPDLVLAGQTHIEASRSIRRRLDVAVHAHGSSLFFVVGHHDCAGNPTDKAGHLKNLEAAVTTVQSWIAEGQVHALLVDENWVVHEVGIGRP